MKQYSTFIFDSCVFLPETGKIELNYALDDEVFFTETIILPTPYALRPTPPSESALFALHLIGGISYYKTCCPKTIKIRSGSLSPEQAKFWNTLYTKGLGEFFFRNQINFHDLIDFPSASITQSKPTPYALRPTPKLLVPIGGGKDSTVTVELLKKAGYDITLFRIGKHPLIEETAKIMELPLLTVERHLSPALFNLNAEGALNGHVPITAYLSLLSAIIAEIYGFDAVVMSNERSANEGNTEYLGETINHQWSKSIECERMLRIALKDSGSPVEYFSLLRPLSELSIVQLFAALPQYFSCVTSCNTNWRLTATLSPSPSPIGGGAGGGGNRWCAHCPKCAFAFTMFSAFLPEEKLMEIFGKNLFNEEALQPFFRQLLGLEGFKPFECVGTPEETSAAFLLAHERKDLEDTKAMQLFVTDVLPKIRGPKKLIDSVLKAAPDHCIPKSFTSVLHAHS
ncbi:MAG: hypothetical protein PHE68_03260 [Candidatus Peribacteraceae bacterium]|nr:hypothetical protein [Candidatus Peribacteraceae bacterium]